MVRSCVIIGAGPAGLTAAEALSRQGVRTTVLEQGSRVGGLARTEQWNGYRFDIGGHRFYTRAPEVEALWHEWLGPDLLQVRRLSRIYYNGRFFHYPLAPWNTLFNLGLVESGRIVASYLKACLRPLPLEETFEQWVINRFGERLYRTFFKAYTEKVWGLPCSSIRAEWAAQRIKGLSLFSTVANAVLGLGRPRSLIHQFYYPRLGPGQMWERVAERIESQRGVVDLNTRVDRIRHGGGKVRAVVCRSGAGRQEHTADAYVSSMPINHLIARLDPAPPSQVLSAAASLRHRDFLLVALVIDQADLFPDNWIYIHTPTVKVGRIQNFKNWSADLVPDPGKTCLGMEYFCSHNDDLWRLDDDALIRLATTELSQLGLARPDLVEGGCVIRQRGAYPVYDEDYRRHLAVLRDYLQHFVNLQTIGRNGMHRYNNQDHSMLCGLHAAANLLGAGHDLWEINTERSYYEEQVVSRAA